MKSGLSEKPGPVISLQSVCAGYEGDTVLEGISFDVQAGDYFALIGPNGGGKTTLVKVILGLVKPYQGKVEVFGKPAHEGRSQIGYVPQAQYSDKDFPIKVWDVVSMGRLSTRGLSKKLNSEDRQIIADSLQRTAMYEHRERSIGDLSGGQRQRVFISRALACHPSLLLLDEPTANIDEASSLQLYSLLDSLNASGVTVILVSHDLHMLERHARRIAYVDRGLVFQEAHSEGLEMAESEHGKGHNHD